MSAYKNLLQIGMQVSSGARGFLISLAFRNTDPQNSIEIWFPIDGYLDLQRNEKGYIRNEYVCRILETNPYVASPTGNSRKTRERVKPSITREKQISKKEENNISPVATWG
ncbi:hypothetical protein [Saccharolobus solfataricus]|uniref:Uncharacterized protein plr n=1 Tax=Saccharolobus solfataricus TaxID=2287 RepID=Q9UXN2_SACSO|nr:hypothetical protein [Saccharolobus solfataricus]CAB51942.1 hypothetical protein [Saccharolobus solfataricus]